MDLAIGMLCIALPFLGVVGLVVLLVSIGRKRAAERQALVSGWALHRDWEYAPSDPALVNRFEGAPFGRGHARSATNVVRGRHDGRHFVAFDYHYTTSSGENSSRHQVSVLAMSLGVQTPGLAVGRTTSFGRLWNSLTGRDVPTGDEMFDRTFTVVSPSAEFAQDVLNPTVKEIVWRWPDLAWRLAGDSMLVIRTGTHDPHEVEAKLHFMDDLIDRIPPYVIDRLGGGR